MIATRFFTHLLLPTLLGLSSLAAAESDRRFQIDILVFANNDPNAVYAEHWPDNLGLRYPAKWQQLPPPPAADDQPSASDTSPVSPQRSLQRMSDADADAEFANAVKSLRLSSRYRPLFQASWRQELVSRRQAPAILVQGGDKRGDHYELEGYIKVAVERYLYLDTNLWFSQFGYSENSNYYLPRLPYMERQQETLAAPAVDEQYLQDKARFMEQNPEFRQQQDTAQRTPIQRIVVMDQQRRLRSNELHFLDHPLFGVLVKISRPDSQLSAPKLPE